MFNTFFLYEGLSNNLWGSDDLLFLEFINMVSILYYTFIEFIIVLYHFLVISFAWYKQYMIWRISFNKVSDALPAFTCAGAIGNLWSIYLGVIFCDKKGQRPHGQRL